MGFNQRLRIGLPVLLACCFSAPLAAHEPGQEESKSPASTKTSKKALDRSGEPAKGKASYYGKEFFGRTMADGTPMDPESNIAASRTLPLGTKAKVTNLDNGKSAVVEIRDRGPYVEGRIVDLTPKTAEQLDMIDEGVVPVEVTPIEVPQRDGSVKPGAAASDSEQDGKR
jgi:rare lipoprotein A